jgi:hypothetical protein
MSLIDVKPKLYEHTGDLLSPGAHHGAVICLKNSVDSCTEANWEMAWIEERDRHWEYGIDVSPLCSSIDISIYPLLECISNTT